MQEKKVDQIKKITYYDKYLALQKDYLSIEDLEILNEQCYEKSRQKMNDYLKEIKLNNQNNPNQKYRYFDTKPYKISKEFYLKVSDIDEDYIFKKAKQELQLKSLMKGE